jgi:hypothetical protein
VPAGADAAGARFVYAGAAVRGRCLRAAAQPDVLMTARAGDGTSPEALAKTDIRDAADDAYRGIRS